jgi:hydrogen peroxide-dependent heme synthase
MEPNAKSVSLPAAPLTIEGHWVLHQMARIRWENHAAEHEPRLERLIQNLEASGSAVFSLVGHKGDLMFIHFRKSLEELNRADVMVSKAIAGLADIVNSYVSVVELGLYESSVKLYESLVAKGIAPGTPEWSAAVDETLQRQKAAMSPRLFPEIPDSKYLCFYPMNKRRGEHKNWYSLPIQDRQRQMAEHGEIGRKYAGTVRQIISGSIGYDDWEWGVDLFTETPVVFKQLIYEMRFDEASAVYAEFGPFFVGVRLRQSDVAEYLNA